MLTTAGVTFCTISAKVKGARPDGVSMVCGWVVVVSAVANGTLLPSVSPNALVAKRAAATRRAGLRVSFRHRGLSFVAELSSSFIGEPLSPEKKIPLDRALHQRRSAASGSKI